MIGLVIHSVLNKAAKGLVIDIDSFENVWEEELSRIEDKMRASAIEAHLVPLSSSLRYYEVKKVQAWNIIKKEFIGKKNIGSHNVYLEAEKRLESSSGKMAGRIDLVLASKESIAILDYKSGKIMDENDNIKEEYAMQMKLYAALYYETTGKWPDKLMLSGLDRTRHEILYSHEESLQLLHYFSNKLEEVNGEISSGIEPFELATPSPKACFYCNYRPSCKKYWESRDDSGEWPNDIRGEAIEKKLSLLGTLMIVLCVEGKNRVIRGITRSHEIMKDIPIGITICNLTLEENSGQFKENMLTTYFRTDDIRHFWT